jgi:heme exporter protein C
MPYLRIEVQMNKKPIFLWLLDGITLIFMIAAILVIFFATPADASTGDVQKVFYFHIAAGWAGLVSILVGMFTAVGYLSRRTSIWDIFSVSAIEVGLLFSVITVASGMIWARPTWLTWWTWDPRLTTMAILIFIYAAYFILRTGIDNLVVRRKVAAVYAILGSLTVPLTFFSIRAFRSIHPVVIGNGDAAPFLSERMLPACWLSLIAFTLLEGDLIWHRSRIGLSMEEKRAQENG